MSDRGSNLVKALRDYDTLFCFLHRVNNILKRSFFQLSNQKVSIASSTTATTTTEDSGDQSASCTEDEDIFVPTIPIRTRRKKAKEQTSSSYDPMTMHYHQLPIEAQEVIRTIEHCKNLVRYVKKVSKLG